MSATEELRRLLRERGVKCHQRSGKYGHSIGWTGSNEYLASAEQWGDDALLVRAILTPEQAVTATMGDDTPVYLCPKCGVAYELDFIDKEFGKSNYCPHCGYRRLYV